MVGRFVDRRSAHIKRSENLTRAQSDSDSCVAATWRVRLTDAFTTVLLTISRQIRPPTHHNRRHRSRRALARWTCSTPYWVHHAAPTSSASAASLVDAELSAYLQAEVISRTESPTEWWAANAAKYPLLAAEAKCYLSAPPMSVASKHVFSAAGQIYTDKRLLPSVGKNRTKITGKKIFDFLDF